jgi:hypothetical protein
LEHSGRGVQIAIHADVVDRELPSAGSPIVLQSQPDSSGLLMLNATDMLFLRDLKISVEAGVPER